MLQGNPGGNFEEFRQKFIDCPWNEDIAQGTLGGALVKSAAWMFEATPNSTGREMTRWVSAESLT